MNGSLTAARIVVVSGKGGVGKTTVSAALAVAAARRGDRVLIADLEDRESVAPLFGHDRLAYDEAPIAEGISGVSIVPDEALVEYFRVVYRVPRVSRALLRSKAVEFVTQVAPGLRDILLVGSLREAERADGRNRYDLVVVDAPPTGRLPRLLDAPRAVVDLVRAGPIKPQAQKVLDLVLDPVRLQVVLVTHPEEMPVRETIEAAEALQKMGVALGPLVVNGVWPPIEGLGRSPDQTLRARAAERDLDLDEETLAALATVAGAHDRRARNQRGALKDLASVSLPQIELPYLFTERIARDELDLLAGHLEEHL